ncbi:MAG: hypothetical protein ACK5ZD_07640, partial [Hyphomonadaceae bacterium]
MLRNRWKMILRTGACAASVLLISTFAFAETPRPMQQKERPKVSETISFANPHDLALAPKLAAREADWRIGPVVYQVMVDRFAPSRDLEAKRALYATPRTLQPWSKAPTRGKLLPEQG